MTPEMIASWIASGRGEVEANRHSPAVQGVDEIRAQMRERLPQLNTTAEGLYERWIEKLRR